MTTVLKLGGSVITHKDEPETVDDETLAAVVDTIADAIAARQRTGDAADGDGDDGGAELVLVHGGGSFGHHHAAAHGVSATAGSADPEALAAIHGAMTDLNDAVVDVLQARGVRAVPVSPLSVASRDADGNLDFPVTAVDRMLGEGFVPVLHGDVVVHEDAGGTILSGDEIVAAVAESLSADRVGLCSTVSGVLDRDGEVIPRITDYEDVAEAVGASDATDVTGGMAGKVRTLLALDVPATIFDPDALGAFLAGERVGTTVEG